MDIAFVDFVATHGDSFLHRSSIIAKLFLLLSLIISAMLANRLLQFVPLIILLFIGYLSAGIPLRKVCHYALYPAFFSLIFAFFKFTSSFALGLIVISKAITVALALLLFILTTPYPELFGILSRFLPSILVDGMFFTYRILFILLRQVKNLLTNVRLKGGYHPWRLFFNLRNLAGAIGVIFIHAFDLSERMHQVLMVRGYGGQIKLDYQHKFHQIDLLICVLGIGINILVVIL